MARDISREIAVAAVLAMQTLDFSRRNFLRFCACVGTRRTKLRI
jgi:hypothetical protein